MKRRILKGTVMFITATKQVISRFRERAENERYRRYAEAKRKIPMNLSPAEYEAEVRKLARRYKI